MVATAGSKTRMTPEEFLAMEEEYARGFELVDGQLEERPLSKASSHIGVELAGELRAFIRPRQLGRLYGSNLNFRCFVDDPGRFRRADVAFISSQTEPMGEFIEEGVCTAVPDLVAEVVSPNDGAYDVDRKINEWLDAGVKVVLRLMPETRTIQVYRPIGDVQQFRYGDELVIDDLLPGFCTPVRNIFSD